MEYSETKSDASEMIPVTAIQIKSKYINNDTQQEFNGEQTSLQQILSGCCNNYLNKGHYQPSYIHPDMQTHVNDKSKTLLNHIAFGYEPMIYTDYQLMQNEDTTINISFFINTLSLGLQGLPLIEPLCISFAVFQQISNQYQQKLERLTEWFTMDFTNFDTEYMLNNSSQVDFTRCFQVKLPKNITDVFLVIQIDKLLTDDIDRTHNLYHQLWKSQQNKSNQQNNHANQNEVYFNIYFKDIIAQYDINDQHKKQLQEDLLSYQTYVHNAVSRLGYIRQPFLVGFCPILCQYQQQPNKYVGDVISKMCQFNIIQQHQENKNQQVDTNIHGSGINIKSIQSNILNYQTTITPTTTFQINNIKFVQYEQDGDAQSGSDVIEKMFNNYFNGKAQVINYVFLEINFNFMNSGQINKGKLLITENHSYYKYITQNNKIKKNNQFYETINIIQSLINEEKYYQLTQYNPEMVYNTYMINKLDKQLTLKYTQKFDTILCLQTQQKQQVVDLYTKIILPVNIVDYNNHMFINLKQLIKQNVKKQNSHQRNLIVQVELKNEQNQSLQVFYSKYHRELLCYSQISSCQYHNEKPVFTDEFKLQLPDNINQDFYLLFTVYQISINNVRLHQANVPKNLDTDLVVVQKEYKSIFKTNRDLGSRVNQVYIEGNSVFKPIMCGKYFLFSKLQEQTKAQNSLQVGPTHYFDDQKSENIQVNMYDFTKFVHNQKQSNNNTNQVSDLKLIIDIQLNSNIYFHHYKLQYFELIYQKLQLMWENDHQQDEQYEKQIQVIAEQLCCFLDVFIKELKKGQQLKGLLNYVLKCLINNSLLNMSLLFKSLQLCTLAKNNQISIHIIKIISSYCYFLEQQNILQMDQEYTIKYNYYRIFVDQLIQCQSNNVILPKFSVYCQQYNNIEQFNQILNSNIIIDSYFKEQINAKFQFIDTIIQNNQLQSNKLKYFAQPFMYIKIENNHQIIYNQLFYSMVQQYVKINQINIVEVQRLLFNTIFLSNLTVNMVFVILVTLDIAQFEDMDKELLKETLIKIKQILNSIPIDLKHRTQNSTVSQIFAQVLAKAFIYKQIKLEQIFVDQGSDQTILEIDLIILQTLIQSTQLIRQSNFINEILQIINKYISTQKISILKSYCELLIKLLLMVNFTNDNNIQKVFDNNEYLFQFVDILLKQIRENDIFNVAPDIQISQSFIDLHLMILVILFITYHVLYSNKNYKFDKLINDKSTVQYYLTMIKQFISYIDIKKIVQQYQNASGEFNVLNSYQNNINIQMYYQIYYMFQNTSYNKQSDTKDIITATNDQQAKQSQFFQKDDQKLDSVSQTTKLMRQKLLAKKKTLNANVSNIFVHQDAKSQIIDVTTMVQEMYYQFIEEQLILIQNTKHLDIIQCLELLSYILQQCKSIDVFYIYQNLQTKFEQQLKEPQIIQDISSFVLQLILHDYNEKQEQILIDIILQYILKIDETDEIFTVVLQQIGSKDTHQDEKQNQKIEKVELIFKTIIDQMYKQRHQYVQATVKEKIGKYFQILQTQTQLIEINTIKQKHDVARMVELLYQDYNKLGTSIDKKIDKLTQIITKTEEGGYFIELAYQYMEISLLICQHIDIKYENISQYLTNQLYPLFTEQQNQDTSVESQQTSINFMQSIKIKKNDFSINNLFQFLQKSCQIFDNYGYTNYVFHLNNTIRNIILKYQIIDENFTNISSLKQYLTNEQQAQNPKLLGYFYKIGFYSLYKEFQEKEYIYHVNQSIRLQDITSDLIKWYTEIYQRMVNKVPSEQEISKKTESSTNSIEKSEENSVGSMIKQQQNQDKQQVIIVQESEKLKFQQQKKQFIDEKLKISVVNVESFEFCSEWEEMIDKNFGISQLMKQQFQDIKINYVDKFDKYLTKNLQSHIFSAYLPIKHEVYGQTTEQFFYFIQTSLPNNQIRQQVVSSISIIYPQIISNVISFQGKLKIIKLKYQYGNIQQLFMDVSGVIAPQVNEGMFKLSQKYYSQKSFKDIQVSSQQSDSNLTRASVSSINTDTLSIQHGSSEFNNTELVTPSIDSQPSQQLRQLDQEIQYIQINKSENQKQYYQQIDQQKQKELFIQVMFQLLTECEKQLSNADILIKAQYSNKNQSKQEKQLYDQLISQLNLFNQQYDQLIKQLITIDELFKQKFNQLLRLEQQAKQQKQIPSLNKLNSQLNVKQEK